MRPQMNLDPQIAETIVTNLKDVINHEINLFDTTGTIIASTDRTRIGTSHDGARLAIRTKKTISIDRENEYRGARHGINVPVMFNDQVVAVIGITGERSEVEPFGNVIKKMTEILIRENWDSVVRYDHRTRISSLVGMLKLKRHDANLVAYHASLMRIDLNLPRFCVVGRIRSDCEEVADYNSLYTMLHARFQQMRTSFFAFMDHEVCLFVDAREMRALPALLEGIRQDGVLKGYYAYAGEEGLEIREPLFLPGYEEEFRISVGELADRDRARRDGRQEIMVHACPLKFAGDKKPLIMARIVSLRKLLSALKVPEEESVDCAFAVIDPLITGNSRIWKLTSEPGETELHVRETEDSEGVLPVADLAELIFGRVMPEELSDREGVILTEHLAGELEKITKLTRVCFNEIV